MDRTQFIIGILIIAGLYLIGYVAQPNTTQEPPANGFRDPSNKYTTPENPPVNSKTPHPNDCSLGPIGVVNEEDCHLIMCEENCEHEICAWDTYDGCHSLVG